MSDAQLYPEHEKLTRHVRLSDATQAFGSWLEDNGYSVCELVCRSCGRSPDGNRHYRHGEDVEWTRAPIKGGIQGVLAEAFDIDLEALEAEKQSMLDRLRQDQAGQPGIVEVAPPNPPHTFGPDTEEDN